MNKQRLELDWVGKDAQKYLEPRILIDVTEDHGVDTKPTAFSNDYQGNRLIHGDNLLALKAIESDFQGKIRCIFIDPPYNTGSAFAQYDDGLEHSLWLTLMRDRLLILRRLLCESGSIWITIDDNECHYLKVMCDEIFGRGNFIASFVWEKDKGGRGDAAVSSTHDYILAFAKNRAVWDKTRNLLPRTDTQLGRFRNPDNDPRGPWRQGDDGTAKSGSEKQRFPITLPSGRIVTPKQGRFWAFSKETFEQALREGRVYFGKDGDSLPVIKRYISEVREGVAPKTWWTAEEVGTNQSAKRDHLRKLLPDIEPFATPKPEQLLHRIFSISTNPGDWVLDSFAGSGTTGAVAQKMGLKWIMVELGEHYKTHIIPRLECVVSGKDPGGITDIVGWKGGGSYRVYSLAPSLLCKDSRGNWIISPTYDAPRLAQAVCKHEGFKFWPDSSIYWKQGYSSEKDFIFVTTEFLTTERLDKIASQLKPDESLLICAKAFKVAKTKYSNITIKKIPQMLLGRCEFGREDYSFNLKEPYQPDLGFDEEETLDNE